MGDILCPISQSDCFALREMELLLRQKGIRRDTNLDYSCGVYDEDENLVATGSCFGNTIRCLAVSSSRRGQGLLVQIVSHLMNIQAQRIAAVVMNANPFTLGHRYLVEQASRENDVVYLFLLSEEVGPIPFAVRRRLVEAGVEGLSNVVLQESGSYMISFATFPSYFLKDEDAGPLGRLLDMDVMDIYGDKLDRSLVNGKSRDCVVCGAPGRGCASRRLHTVDQLQAAVTEIMESHFFREIGMPLQLWPCKVFWMRSKPRQSLVWWTNATTAVTGIWTSLPLLPAPKPSAHIFGTVCK